MRKPLVRALASAGAAAALAVAVAACGSSANVSASGGASGPSAHAARAAHAKKARKAKHGARAKGAITIGMITSLSGPYSPLGGFDQKTVELLEHQLNAAGGIDGRKVNVIIKDDRTDPTQAVVDLKSLVASKPLAIIGPVLSTACSAVESGVQKAKVPMVTLCAYDGQAQPVRPYDFMATLSTHAMTDVLGRYLKSVHKTKVALIHDSSSFGQSGVQTITQQKLLHVVTNQSYNLSATTFTPQLQAAMSSNPQAIVVWGAGPPLVSIAQEYKQLGGKVPLVMSGAAATPLFVGPAGAAGNGVIMASSIANVFASAPRSNKSARIDRALAKSYQAKYHEPMSQFTADACGAFKVIVQGIKNAGANPTPAKVRNAIEKHPTVACHGTYKYTRKSHFGISSSDVWVVTDQNGKLVPTRFSLARAKKS